MTDILLSPPSVFLIFIFIFLALSHAVRNHAAVGRAAKRKNEAYAGGLSEVDHRVAPEYGKFYAFTLFFTVMQAVVLFVATVPSGSLTLPLLYVAGGSLALLIIFRR